MNNLVSPVLFQEGLRHIPENAVVVEIAPHSLLQVLPSVTAHGMELLRRQNNSLAFLFLFSGVFSPVLTVFSPKYHV